MIDAKELKKIVQVCHKNGIVKLKSGDFEIELKEKEPKAKQSKEEVNSQPTETFPSWDSLSPEQRLLWSSTPDIPQST